MTTFSRAIPQFWYNMKKMGAVISIRDGSLHVSKPENESLLNEYVKAEIVKRAPMLVELLTIPTELEPIIAQYLHQPLTNEEAQDAEHVSKNRGWELEFHNFDDWRWYAFRPKRLEVNELIAIRTFAYRATNEMQWGRVKELEV